MNASGPMGSFRPGELVKRKGVSPRARALCIIISENTDNYTLYNLSLKQLSIVAKVVVEGLYNRI